MMSSTRSRSGGTAMTSKARRSRRSARNRPAAASAGRSALVAPISRTSTWMVLVAADPLERAIFDDAQELLLDRERGGGDLVEEQRAAVGELEAGQAAPLGAGVGAGLVAEQLAVEELLGQGRAVELDERALPAGRQVGQPVGDDLLAGAALAENQDRPVDRGGLADMRQHFEKGRRLAKRRGRDIGGASRHIDTVFAKFDFERATASMAAQAGDLR